MSKSTWKEQHRTLQNMMRSHQLTPEWEEQHGRVLIAPGITVYDSIRHAKAFRDIVLDPESGHYIYLGMSGPGGKSAKLQQAGDHLESLELEEARKLLGTLQKELKELIQEVAAVLEAAQT